MKVKTTILDRLKTDLTFKREAALAMGIGEAAINHLIKVNSDGLTRDGAILFFKSKGYSDAEIIQMPKLSKSA